MLIRCSSPGFARSISCARGFTLLEILIALAIVAILASIAVPSYQAYVEKARIAQAMADINDIEQSIERFYVGNNRLPADLTELGKAGLRDPWGSPYQYLNIATAMGLGMVRKDRSLVPINSDYDLYSMGADGQSVSPLTAEVSRDDIVRANNGGFVGLASDY